MENRPNSPRRVVRRKPAKRGLLAEIKQKPVVYHVLLICGVVVAIILASSLLMHVVTRHGTHRTVPDFSGVKIAEAQQIAKKTKLEIIINDSLFVPAYEGGIVLDQLPKGGVEVKAGRKVYIGAADTFRAAAIDQLAVWAERAGATMIRQEMGSDPASVAFDTLRSAVANGADVVLIDTAGRLHNKVGLMKELTKIRNVMSKVIPDAPHEVMLVLDGSTGQNAFEQAKQFTEATQVTSLAITKLDGTAKGGVVIGISDRFHIPVRYIGIGEGIDQLKMFDRREFVRALFGDKE